jgi:two-component system, cell cycle sensor histidine kinase and response regulator CckA
VATVLVVDDVAVNRDLVRTVLRHQGHVTVEASGGAAALEVLAHERPDLVLTDVVMPEMDGYDLARAIRADTATQRIPILFYTANYLASEFPKAAVPDGVPTRIVPKTGNLTELLEAVEEALHPAS